MDTPIRGRPRDERIDGSVLTATRELLATDGFAATTVQAVARRAGVGTAAIYRRWPSRLELIVAATSGSVGALEVRPTGNLRADVSRFVHGYLEMFGSPVARVALPGVLSLHPSEAAEYRELLQGVGRDIRPAFRAVLAAAPAGSVDPGVDVDAVFDTLIGSALYRALIHPFTGRDGSPDDLVEVVLRALRPSSRPATPEERND